jgi:alkylhydroperoxidase family enzyme
MTRIPSHSIEDAPQAARALLAEMVQFSPTGRPLNLHAQMAHAPAVLEAYVSIRRATARHGTLDPRVRSALMLAAAVHDRSDYALAIISMLAQRSGWHPDQVEALLAGKDLGEDKTDVLISVVREAAANSGHVSDLAWARAVGLGWSDEQLAEAFAYLGLTVFTSYFLNYAGTELDIPASVPGVGPADTSPPATTSGAGS